MGVELIISDPRAFYVFCEQNNKPVKSKFTQVNPLAQGLTISKDTSTEPVSYIVSWFDKLNISMRSIDSPKKPEQPDDHTYKVIINDAASFYYVFQLIDKKIYDQVSRSILLNPPDFKNDQEIQDYLINYNPYD